MSQENSNMAETLYFSGKRAPKDLLLLIEAIKTKNFKAAHEIIKNNPQELNEIFQDDFKFTHPLKFACDGDYFEMADFLFERGANINTQDRYGKTMLMHALTKTKSPHKDKTLSWLFKNKESLAVNLKDDGGYTALMYAVSSEEISATHELLAMGADINLTSLSKETVLHLAVRYNAPRFVLEVLIHAGVDIHHRNCDAETALNIAQSVNNQDTVDFLKAIALAQSESQALEDLTHRIMGNEKPKGLKKAKSL